MASIRDFVRLNIPETYGKLTTSGNLDGQGDNPDVVGAQVANVMSRLWPTLDPREKEQTLTEFAKSYIGDMVTRLVIPAGIDYWQVQSRRTEGIVQPAGFDPGGGETAVYYDKVNGLIAIDNILAARIAALAEQFGDSITPPTQKATAGFGVSSQGKPGLAQDPFTTWSKIQHDPWFVQLGVPILVRTG